MFLLITATLMSAVSFTSTIQNYDSPSIFALLAGLLGEIFDFSINLELFDSQLFHLFFQSWLFLLFFYTVRIRWKIPPKIILYPGVAWFSVLTFFVLLWEPIKEPNSSSILFWELPNRFASEDSSGYGLMASDELVLYSTQHTLIFVLFAIYVFSLMFYAMWTARPVRSSEELIKARQLWITNILTGLAYFIWSLPWFPYFAWLEIGFIIAMMSVLGYASYRYPESMFLSDAQLIRGLQMLDQVQKLTKKEAVAKFGMPSVIEYLYNIPPEIVNRLNIKGDQEQM